MISLAKFGWTIVSLSVTSIVCNKRRCLIVVVCCVNVQLICQGALLNSANNDNNNNMVSTSLTGFLCVYIFKLH